MLARHRCGSHYYSCCCCCCCCHNCSRHLYVRTMGQCANLQWLHSLQQSLGNERCYFWLSMHPIAFDQRELYLMEDKLELGRRTIVRPFLCGAKGNSS